MTLKSKPGRPFGVTIAILLSTLLYSIVPLIEVTYLLIINQLIYQDDETGALIGFNILESATFPIFLQAFVALAFLLVAYVAWRGINPQIRLIFIGVVVTITVAFISLLIVPSLLNSVTIEQGIDSIDTIIRQSRIIQSVLLLLIMVYTIWYMNRWAAKAFYRGYYIESDFEHLREVGVNPDEFVVQSSSKLNSQT